MNDGYFVNAKNTIITNIRRTSLLGPDTVFPFPSLLPTSLVANPPVANFFGLCPVQKWGCLGQNNSH